MDFEGLDVVLLTPTPTRAHSSERLTIRFEVRGSAYGGNIPLTAAWLDDRQIEGEQRVVSENDEGGDDIVRWIGAIRVRPGRHVFVAAGHLYAKYSAKAWTVVVD